MRARGVFEGVLRGAPDQASAHVGLANACIMQFEMTRADESPDTAALTMAAHHAREACRLEPGLWRGVGDAGVRARSDRPAPRRARRVETRSDARSRQLAASSPAGLVSWGEERLREARRTLALLPGFPIAHWLCATVHVARQAWDEAERELDAGIAAQASQQTAPSRFSGVALHWLRGLVHLARGDERRALESLERELSFEASGHLYARECCANTWYAIGALHQRRQQRDKAVRGFEEALARVPRHPLARLGLSMMHPGGETAPARVSAPSFDAAIVHVAQLVLAGDATSAARLLDHALAAAPSGNAGWLLPVEPLLNVSAATETWAPVLARLRSRAA